MTYRMFIDDERFPVDDNWIIVRTVEEAIDCVNVNGAPYFISFDNDLGEGMKEGRDFAKWLVDADIEQNILGENFQWFVHSQNPVARDAINNLLDNYMSFKNMS